jgi:aspartyl protease family protein
MSDSSDPSQYYGKGMLLGAWIFIISLFAFFFWQWNKKETAAKAPEIRTVHDTQETILTRNGHQYLAKGQINQVDVTFLLDTGATEIVVPLKLAKKLNLPKGIQSEAITAGGKVDIYSTRIKELVIGHIVLHDLNASINPHMSEDEVLLGMSALKRINFWQEDDKLILKTKNTPDRK